MLIFALKIALCIAVSLSQLAGGTPCCCLTRFLSSALTISFQSNIRSQVLAENPPSGSTCPKCCQHRLESKTDTLKSNPTIPRGRTASVSSDAKCNCFRSPSICSPDEKSFLPYDIELKHVLSNEINKYDCLPNSANVKTAYTPPILHRHAGCSWQSLACVWKS